MEEKEIKDKEKQEYAIENTLRVGDISLSSPTYSIYQLADLVITMLQQKEIKEYLDLIKRKKSSAGYLG